jgi:hypothetical protein
MTLMSNISIAVARQATAIVTTRFTRTVPFIGSSGGLDGLREYDPRAEEIVTSSRSLARPTAARPGVGYGRPR